MRLSQEMDMYVDVYYPPGRAITCAMGLQSLLIFTILIQKSSLMFIYQNVQAHRGGASGIFIGKNDIKGKGIEI